tara:strand:- start:1426 stop:1899 length:474 start_codon:yes stop_codon:yes gene_type:complete
MNSDYLNIYNNLIKLTRNKSLYLNLKENETFSDRLVFLLLHLSFFFKIYKSKNNKETTQKIHDFIFKQIELSIREIGYGDVSINKNMKKYVNFFYDILLKIDRWDSYETKEKCEILNSLINYPKNISFYANYFDKLSSFYKNNTLNYFTKDIEEFKI